MKKFIFGGRSYTDYYVKASTYVEAYEKASYEAGEPLWGLACPADGIDVDLPDNEADIMAYLEKLDKVNEIGTT